MNSTKRNFLLAATAALLAWGGASFARAGYIESLELLEQIRPGVTTAEEVRKLLGPPVNTMKFPSQGIETLEYDAPDRLKISIAIKEGKVLNVVRQRPSF